MPRAWPQIRGPEMLISQLAGRQLQRSAVCCVYFILHAYQQPPALPPVLKRILLQTPTEP
jgi:hypothetical protein